MKIIIITLITVAILFCILYYFNPVIFRDTPRVMTIKVDLGATHKGAWGKYSEVVLADGTGILVEKNANGESTLQKLYSGQIIESTFKVKVSNYCDIRHGCFDVIEGILKDNL